MIEKLKFLMFFVITLAIVVLLGYWAIMTIKPASLSVEKQKQAELQQQNDDLQRQIASLNNQIQSLKDAQTPKTTTISTPPTTTTPPAQPTLKYQSLINDLQKLVDANIFMKKGSQGTRVGTVQTFLNIYNNTSKAVDNDYGPGTVTDVANFQKAVGLTADGQAGPSTFNKMISWLKTK